MRVLVCGGRDYATTKYPNDEEEDRKQAELERMFMRTVLDKFPITEIIHGAARGADTAAGVYAKMRNIPVRTFPVTPQDWGRLGKSAGYLRNKKMLKEGRPEAVIAFPGGKGTAHMVALANQEESVTVYDYRLYTAELSVAYIRDYGGTIP